MKYGKIEVKYFLNSTLLKPELVKYLYRDKNYLKKFDNSKVIYISRNKKIIIKYGMDINIGILDSNNIFYSQILIKCSGDQSLKDTFNYLSSFKIENFANQVNIIEKNIGKYKGNNIVVFLNEIYIPKETRVDENQKKIQDNQNNIDQQNNGIITYKGNNVKKEDNIIGTSNHNLQQLTNINKNNEYNVNVITNVNTPNIINNQNKQFEEALKLNIKYLINVIKLVFL